MRELREGSFALAKAPTLLIYVSPNKFVKRHEHSQYEAQVKFNEGDYFYSK